MDDPRAARVRHLHDQIRQGRYEVDPAAVAAALLRRLLEGRQSGAGRG